MEISSRTRSVIWWLLGNLGWDAAKGWIPLWGSALVATVVGIVAWILGELENVPRMYIFGGVIVIATFAALLTGFLLTWIPKFRLLQRVKATRQGPKVIYSELEPYGIKHWTFEEVDALPDEEAVELKTKKPRIYEAYQRELSDRMGPPGRIGQPWPERRDELAGELEKLIQAVFKRRNEWETASLSGDTSLADQKRGETNDAAMKMYEWLDGRMGSDVTGFVRRPKANEPYSRKRLEKLPDGNWLNETHYVIERAESVAADIRAGLRRPILEK